MSNLEHCQTDYRKHPSYSTGYDAGVAARPRRGRSNAYDAGYDAGVRAANAFLANGFRRDCGGFRIALGPITTALLTAQGTPTRRAETTGSVGEADGGPAQFD